MSKIKVDPDVVNKKLSTEGALSMYFLYEYLADKMERHHDSDVLIARASMYVFLYLSNGASDLSETLPAIDAATLFAGAFAMATLDHEFTSCSDATASDKANDLVYRIRDLTRTYPKASVDLYAHVDHDTVRQIEECSAETNTDQTFISNAILARMTARATEKHNENTGKEKRRPGRPRTVTAKTQSPGNAERWNHGTFPRDYLLAALRESLVEEKVPIAKEKRHPPAAHTRNKTKRADRCPNGFVRNPITRLCTHRQTGQVLSQFERARNLPVSVVSASTSNSPITPETTHSPVYTRRRCPNGQRRIPAKTGECTKINTTGGTRGLKPVGTSKRYFFTRGDLLAISSIGMWKCVCALYQMRMQNTPTSMEQKKHRSETLILRFLSAMPDSYRWSTSVVEATCAAIWGPNNQKSNQKVSIPIDCAKYVVYMGGIRDTTFPL